MRNIFFYFLIFFFSTIEKKSVGQNWVPFPIYFNTAVWWLSVDDINNEMVIGGMFSSVDSIPITAICAWNGASVVSYDSGLRYFTSPGGTVRQSTIYNNEMYVCGAFQKCYNKPDSMNSIAKWTGNEWDTVINVTNEQTIFSVSAIDDTLFIGGQFHLNFSLLSVLHFFIS